MRSAYSGTHSDWLPPVLLSPSLLPSSCVSPIIANIEAQEHTLSPVLERPLVKGICRVALCLANDGSYTAVLAQSAYMRPSVFGFAGLAGRGVAAAPFSALAVLLPLTARRVYLSMTRINTRRV